MKPIAYLPLFPDAEFRTGPKMGLPIVRPRSWVGHMKLTLSLDELVSHFKNDRPEEVEVYQYRGSKALWVTGDLGGRHLMVIVRIDDLIEALWILVDEVEWNILREVL